MRKAIFLILIISSSLIYANYLSDSLELIDEEIKQNYYSQTVDQPVSLISEIFYFILLLLADWSWKTFEISPALYFLEILIISTLIGFLGIKLDSLLDSAAIIIGIFISVLYVGALY